MRLEESREKFSTVGNVDDSGGKEFVENAGMLHFPMGYLVTGTTPEDRGNQDEYSLNFDMREIFIRRKSRRSDNTGESFVIISLHEN